MRGITKTLINGFPLKSEILLRSLPRFVDPNHLEQSFKEMLSNLKGSEKNKKLLIFPILEFKMFPKTSIDSMIKSSYEVLKNSGGLNLEVYTTLFKSYLTHHIDFDLNSILTDMKNNNIEHNTSSYLLLIEIHCRRGEMASVRNLIDLMKLQKIPLNDKVRSYIYYGYIRAGNPAETQRFIEEESLDENNIILLKEKVKALAENVQLSDVIEINKTIREKDADLSDRLVLYIYRGLVKGGASDDQLSEFISSINSFHGRDDFGNMILSLNRECYYNHSLKLLLQFPNAISNREFLFDIVMSFNQRDCPINVYESVIDNYIHVITSNVPTLFSHVDFNTAYRITKNHILTDVKCCLISCLIKKAADTKSFQKINSVIKLAHDNMDMRSFCWTMQAFFIPTLIESGLFTNPTDISALMPENKKLLLPFFFMHYLSHGDFSSFQAWLDANPMNLTEVFNYSKLNSLNIINNVPFAELDRFSKEALKVFKVTVVNWLLSSVIIERIIQLSTTDNVRGISEAVKLAKDLKVTFRQINIEYGMKQAPKYSEIFKEFEVTLKHQESLIEDEQNEIEINKSNKA